MSFVCIAPALRKIIALSLLNVSFLSTIPAVVAEAKTKDEPARGVNAAELKASLMAPKAGNKVGGSASNASTAPAANSAAVAKDGSASKDANTANSSLDKTAAKEDATEHPVTARQSAEATKEAHLLRGSVTQETNSPLMYDKPQELPKGTTVSLVSLANINSEVNRKGDEVWVRVGTNVRGPSEVAVPGGWYMHGLVTSAESQRRLGRDGYVTIQFDKLVSPDRKLEVPIDAQVSSKLSTPKAIAKQVLIDSGHVGLGATGGAIAAIQYGGIGTAVATHGISVGVGAGIGATIGLIGALKRKGSISAITPGEEMKLTFAKPIVMPGFDSKLIPSAKPIAHLDKFEVSINKLAFSNDPWGDRRSKMLTIDVTLKNGTSNEYGFSNLAVVSDREEVYYPDPLHNGGPGFVTKKVKPNTTGSAEVAFNVDGKRHKYWLVLLDRANQKELNRVPIN